MIAHNLNTLPTGLSYASSDLSNLDEWDLKQVSDADEIWYWYTTGDYEGSGYAIIRKGDLYAYSDMGHCSCYGPLETVSEYMTREALLAMIEPNKSLLGDVLELLVAAGLKN